MAAPESELELSAIDAHFARFMTRLAGIDDPAVASAAALASRATANGDICVRLSDFAGRSFPGMVAPALDEWLQALRASRVVGAPGEFRPLVLDESGRLYLYRYWEYETRLAEALRARAVDADGVDEALLRSGLERYFPRGRDPEQMLAAATAVLRRFAVISGGPGTGKTTTVVKILALLIEQARGERLSIAVAAPTGKAAARVQDAMRDALDRIDADLLTRAALPGEAFTLHRLLGARPESVYYRYERRNPLPLDVVVVDEASMADLALAAKLVDALTPRARLILLGDKDQLASVEAGAVLGDVCAVSGYSERFAQRLRAVTGLPSGKLPKRKAQSSPLADSVALLETSYRFGPESGIGRLARAINAGRGADALELVKQGGPGLAWHDIAPTDVRGCLAREVAEALRPYFEAVRENAAPQAVFDRFNAFRVLCAHRSGRFGVAAVNRAIEDVLDEHGLISARQTWYAGRPVMITRNDYNLRLFNGDVGVTLSDASAPEHMKVYFASAGAGLRAVAPSRLPEHETVYAMTIHKSQGSEFRRVTIVLPPELSPVMSRELVYTAITRAMHGVEIWGDATAFVAAVARRMERASALAERLAAP